MFNLIVTYSEDWPGEIVNVPIGRIFEHTEKYIQDRFSDNGVASLDQLAQLPCMFMMEGVDDQLACTGRITRVRIIGKEVELSFAIDRDVGPFRNRDIYTQRRQLLMDDWEFSRNHWAVKDVDLYRTLFPIAVPQRQLPTVFRVSSPDQVDRGLVSAMMPFDAGFDAVANAIRLAADNAGLRCQRADDIWDDPTLIQDIVSLIDRSLIVICDCTGKNANVFYEAGIAHAFGREVILITQNAEDIPFDLRHHRYVHYMSNGEGLAALTARLQERIETIVARG